mmetsp:Transcript_7729/g.24149  ORF Transcript_7729/g.24149 Transcript_7729/m.24149 type:complete len:239 (+) Transcript_7729:1177-1893(+)
MSRFRCCSCCSRRDRTISLPPWRRARSISFCVCTSIPAFRARALASASSSLAFFSACVSCDEPLLAALAKCSSTSAWGLTSTPSARGSSMSSSSRCSPSQLMAGSTPAFAVLMRAFCARSSVKPISSSWSTSSLVTTGGPDGPAVEAASLDALPPSPALRRSISSSVSISAGPSHAASFWRLRRSPMVDSSKVCASGTNRLCITICCSLKHTLPVSLQIQIFSSSETCAKSCMPVSSE